MIAPRCAHCGQTIIHEATWIHAHSYVEECADQEEVATPSFEAHPDLDAVLRSLHGRE